MTETPAPTEPAIRVAAGRPPRRLLVLGAIAIILIGVYAALWSAGAAAMRRTITAIAADARPFDLAVGRLSTGGFPFFLRGDLRDVAVSAGAGWSWSAGRLSVDALPIRPDRFVFTPGERQTLRLGAAGDFDVATLGARLGLSGGLGGGKSAAWTVDAQADSLAATAREGEAALSAKGVLLKAASEAGALLHASLFAGVFEWRAGARRAAGEKLLADIALAPGGLVDVRRFSFETGGAKVALEGRLALDAEGYPAGVLTAKLADPRGFVALLAGLGALDADGARAAAATLSLAAIASGGALEGPIELRNGEARIAGVRLAKLPRLRRPRT